MGASLLDRLYSVRTVLLQNNLMIQNVRRWLLVQTINSACGLLGLGLRLVCITGPSRRDSYTYVRSTYGKTARDVANQEEGCRKIILKSP